MNRAGVFRVLDANLNRLREGLRVVEEFVRFYHSNDSEAKLLKQLRHKVRTIETDLSREELLAGRDSDSDLFRNGSEARELERSSMDELVIANIRRAQESARVLEEYLKLVQETPLSEIAKNIRFELYSLEKRMGIENGQKE
jgi:nucleotidyltransferase/DNA polymerase involved in DNA repair